MGAFCQWEALGPGFCGYTFESGLVYSFFDAPGNALKFYLKVRIIWSFFPYTYENEFS